MSVRSTRTFRPSHARRPSTIRPTEPIISPHTGAAPTDSRYLGPAASVRLSSPKILESRWSFPSGVGPCMTCSVRVPVKPGRAFPTMDILSTKRTLSSHPSLNAFQIRTHKHVSIGASIWSTLDRNLEVDAKDDLSETKQTEGCIHTTPMVRCSAGGHFPSLQWPYTQIEHYRADLRTVIMGFKRGH